MILKQLALSPSRATGLIVNYPSNYCCFTKQQRFYLLFIQTRTSKHKKAVACVYIHEQLLWVAHLIITLSGYIEENPGPLTETNNDKKVLFSKSVNTVSLVESRLLELGRFPVNVLEMETVFSVLCLYNTPEYFYPSKSLFRPKRHIVMFWLKFGFSWLKSTL